jgi:DNA primase
MERTAGVERGSSQPPKSGRFPVAGVVRSSQTRPVAGLVSQHVLEQIRHASDIVDVVGGYVPLKRAGANFQALCPFHKEKTPSFNVNPSKQTYHCFGCGKGGDVFRFIQDYETLPFMDAVRRLAERAKIPLEMDNNPATQQARAVKDTLLQIHEQITQRWQAALTQEGGQIARDYIAKRQISPEAIELFRIGYAPDSWDDTINWGRSKGYESAILEQAGLVVRKEDSDRSYDRFRGRLMFPICDEQGRVIGFSGRVLTGDEKTAKYLNSPETPLFTKGRVIFGLDKSKRAILDAKTAIVCEGQLDLIACFMAGVKNVVAPQGTAFTPDQARVIKRYADEVVLCFDADNAGQNAAAKALDPLLAAGLSVRVMSIPSGKDPDEFIRENGGDAFAELVGNAGGFFDWYLDRLAATNDLSSDKGRVAVVRAMSEAVHKAGSGVLYDTYAQKTALRLGVSPDSMRMEFRKAGRTAAPAPLPMEEEEFEGSFEEQEVLKAPPSEELLLRLLLEHDDLVEQVEPLLKLEWFTHDVARSAVELRFGLWREGSWHGAAAWIGPMEGGPLLSLLTETLASPVPAGDPAAIVFGAQKRAGILSILRDKFVDAQIATISQRLRDPELADEDADHLTRHKLELRLLKGQPLGE